MKIAMLMLGLSLALAVPALADDDDHDHDRARRALQAGEILPLRTILDHAEAIQPGQLLEAELEVEHGRMVYELKVLSPQGRVVKMYLDAATGELVTGKR